MTTQFKIIAGIIIIIILGWFLIARNPTTPIGSVNRAQEYQSTTTNGTWVSMPQKSIFVGSGSLGSVIITSATALAQIDIVDATSTTDTASTTLVSFPATALGGTYTFDLVVFRGLAIRTTAAVASTTITYRPY